ncbi:MAG: hypothetical protein ACLPTF_24245 [Steroidobacteraceae bacterium]
MDSRRNLDEAMDAAEVSVRPQRFLRVGSLRYFEPLGAFVETIAAVVGGPMPKPLRAVRYAGGAPGSEIILACCNPTETLALCSGAEPFASLERQAAGRNDGCLVELTGGIWACTVTGARAPDLLARLGATTALPALGVARIGRLAELAVMSLCIQPSEIMLIVERVYGEHLAAWMRETLADL